MESFIGKEEQFVGDAELEGEPVEVFEDRGDVLPRFRVGEHPGS